MRLKAYIMAADPAWIEASVSSYYNLVTEIVVSYDKQGLSWTGKPIAVDECLIRLRAVDPDHKMQFYPGDYARTGYDPMENDTYQRQQSLNLASREADWVLQLDTDEVMSDPQEFLQCLTEADEQGYSAMSYPARSLYRQLGNGFFLERCSRLWRGAGGFPGPLAIKPNTTLRLARQCDTPAFRVDFRRHSTDVDYPSKVPIHRVIKYNQSILHFSWVRDEQHLLRKFGSWSHARDRNWGQELSKWVWRGRHPYLTVLSSPFARKSHFRIARINQQSLQYLEPWAK